MKRDTLYWKAFWSFFGGIMMFFSFVILPLAIYAVWRPMVPTTFWHMFGAFCIVVILFAPLVAICVWGTVSLVSHFGEEFRAERLEALAEEGKQIMWWGNPLGWLGMLFIWYVRFMGSAEPELNQMASTFGPTPDELSELVPRVKDN